MQMLDHADEIFCVIVGEGADPGRLLRFNIGRPRSKRCGAGQGRQTRTFFDSPPVEVSR